MPVMTLAAAPFSYPVMLDVSSQYCQVCLLEVDVLTASFAYTSSALRNGKPEAERSCAGRQNEKE